jgi:CheY-like chemotaxis protein
VLVADPNVDVGKRTVEALRSWGLSAVLTHDGVEAILEVQRKLPAVIVIDAMLPKMYGFQVCELMKRNESLHEIKVVLVGEVHDQSRYRRPAHDLYGADAYVEHPDMPGGLETHLREFGVPVQTPAGHRESLAMHSAPEIMSPPAQSMPTPVPEPIAPPVPVAPPQPVPMEPPPPVTSTPTPPAEPQAAVAGGVTLPDASQVVLGTDSSADVGALETEVQDDGLADQIAKAERLARIIVSDVVLYNEELFSQAVASGNVVPTMERELAEGRAMFQQRIDECVREGRDFLADELNRVAAQRKASA